MNDTVIAKVCVCAVCVTEAEALSHRPALTRSVAGSYKIYVQFLKVKSKLNLFFGEKKEKVILTIYTIGWVSNPLG